MTGSHRGVGLSLLGMMVLLFTPVPASPQESGRLEGNSVGLFAGFADIAKAKSALELGGYLDVGSYRTPRLRLVLGVDYLSSETERKRLDGSFSDLTFSGDLRLRPLRVKSVVPYGGAGLGIHFRSNDYDDPLIADIYDGIVVGVQVFGGVKVDASDTGRWGLSAELRRVQAQNLDRTSLRVGVFVRR